MSTYPLPGGTAVRPAWRALPEPVRRRVAERLGAAVVSVADQGGGFTPGVAARLQPEAGPGVFLKAVPADHPLADAYRWEGRVAEQLPDTAPAPRLRWREEIEGWTVLAFDDVDGRRLDFSPGSADIPTTVETIAAMSRTLTPCPVPHAEPSARARGDWLHGWQALAQDPPPDLGAWQLRRLPELAEAETAWTGHADGDTLVHGDLRPDNMLVTRDGVMVVDWAHASRGAPWQDIADLVPHLVMAGHSPTQAEKYAASTDAWNAIGPETVTGYAIAYAGYWTRMSREPSPPGVPHLRRYQRRAATAAVTWVRHRTAT